MLKCLLLGEFSNLVSISRLKKRSVRNSELQKKKNDTKVFYVLYSIRKPQKTKNGFLK